MHTGAQLHLYEDAKVRSYLQASSPPGGQEGRIFMFCFPSVSGPGANYHNQVLRNGL
jgi:hypothetical protein